MIQILCDRCKKAIGGASSYKLVLYGPENLKGRKELIAYDVCPDCVETLQGIMRYGSATTSSTNALDGYKNNWKGETSFA